MEDYEILKTVTFSGKYPLSLSDTDLEKTRVLLLDVQVSRKSKTPYFSNKTNPPNGFLGTFCTLAEDFVLKRYDIDFEKQRFVFTFNTDRQDIPTQICNLKRETVNLSAVAQALGIPVFVSDDDYTNALVALPIIERDFYFNCYADTALTVSVQRLKYESCSEFSNQPPSPPKPKKLPEPPTFPPGVSIPPDIYAPPPPGSGSNYEPFPGDVAGDPEVPSTSPCVRYRVNITVQDSGNPGFTPQTYNAEILGVIAGTYIKQISEGNSEIGIIGGRIVGNTCVQREEYPQLTGTPVLEDIVINSIEEIQG